MTGGLWGMVFGAYGRLEGGAAEVIGSGRANRLPPLVNPLTRWDLLPTRRCYPGYLLSLA